MHGTSDCIDNMTTCNFLAGHTQHMCLLQLVKIVYSESKIKVMPQSFFINNYNTTITYEHKSLVNYIHISVVYN